MSERFDISVVLGSKNRKNLIKSTINSIRNNGFNGKIEIIVVDGGSSDGTCNWLGKQKDVFTIIQPNYSIIERLKPSFLMLFNINEKVICTFENKLQRSFTSKEKNPNKFGFLLT